MVHSAMTGPPTTRGLPDNRAPSRSGRQCRLGDGVCSPRWIVWSGCFHHPRLGYQPPVVGLCPPGRA